MNFVIHDALLFICKHLFVCVCVCESRLEICTRRSGTTRELWSATAKEAPSGKVKLSSGLGPPMATRGRTRVFVQVHVKIQRVAQLVPPLKL